MGKGKAKGFRPPRPDDPNTGMLYGSADHLTGDTIASPVQLREEGKPIPQGHLNFGDEWGKGQGKGRGGGVPVPVPPRDSAAHHSATGANSMAVAPKAKAVPPPHLGSKGGLAAKEELAGDAAAAAAPPLPRAVARPAAEAASAAGSGMSEIERRRAAMTEIERRRAEMLEREKALGAAPSLACKEEADEEEREGRAGEEAAAALLAPVAAACKEEDKEGEEEEEEDEVSRAAARRRRADEEEGQEEVQDPGAKRQRAGEGADGPPAAPQAGGAMKQGLQHWAERVNALAGAGSEPDLAQRCRDFVRRRILKAHADGNLHSVDWGEEPLPTLEGLRAAVLG